MNKIIIYVIVNINSDNIKLIDDGGLKKILEDCLANEAVDIDLTFLENNSLYLKQFNPNKMTKSVEDLVLEQNMVIDGEKVYLSPFYYQKHKNYVNSLNLSKRMK